MHPFARLEDELHPVVSVSKDKHDTILELDTDLSPYYIGKKNLYGYNPSTHSFYTLSF